MDSRVLCIDDSGLRMLRSDDKPANVTPVDPPEEDNDSTLTAVLRSDASRRGRLRLLVVGDGIYATHPLPENGSLTIGRSDKADVCIDDPLVSRRHAILHVGPHIQVEDLGSSNGLRVRDARLEPRQSVEVFPGDAIDLGSTTLIVQSGTAALRPRRLWTHGAFEARLEDECARAERSGSSFALVQVRAEGAVPTGLVQEVIGFELRSVDVVATYGPNEYEVLLVDTPVDRAHEIARRLSSRLVDRGARIRIGIACYPRDGTAPEEIAARACALVRGEGEEPQGAAIVVEDGAMQRLHKLVKRIAVGTISVLLMGETGVGKEVLAEAIHRESPRASRPFLRLNCAALSESLLESELFGHERGAFTGAIQQKQGLLETAQGGTVFLDEVGELPPSIQVKLLRVIEERQVYRVGSLKPRPIDVRFVAATNRDLEAEVALGAFRQDLYFRLNGISLVVPPLRERTDEIEGLARAFVAQAWSGRGEARRGAPAISGEVQALLKRYAWPGNIRELRNVMERAVLLCGDGAIQLDHLPVEKMGAPVFPRGGIRPHTPRLPGMPAGGPPRPSMPYGTVVPGFASPTDPRRPPPRWMQAARPPMPLGEHWNEDTVAPATARPEDLVRLASDVAPLRAPGAGRSKIGDEEKSRILEALDRCAGNQTKAARLLGISRRTLVSRLETYSLPRPRKA